MSDGHAELRGGEPAGEGRVRVPVDEHPVGALGEDGCLDAGEHPGGLLGMRARSSLQAVGGRREAELVEEDLRELGVVVLPGVDDNLLETALAERDRERSRLDELRAVADDGEDPHGLRVGEPGTEGGLRPLAILARRGR